MLESVVKEGEAGTHFRAEKGARKLNLDREYYIELV
jgi:hypothetical protein